VHYFIAFGFEFGLDINIDYGFEFCFDFNFEFDFEFSLMKNDIAVPNDVKKSNIFCSSI
jgi:hypothetical protein